MRLSPIRCSTNLISHSWLTVSKNDWMSASNMKFTFLLVIPTQRASSASCAPRPGRNPYENPRKPREQALQITLEVCLVVRPCQPIHTGRGVVLEFEERLLKQIETEVVEERSELLLLPFLCDFPNAVQRLGHAFPVLCPARVSLCRLPLGPCPSLHRLRSQSPGLVHQLRSYY